MYVTCTCRLYTQSIQYLFVGIVHIHIHNSFSFVGIVGLNNIKANDYMNVILLALAHSGTFRDFLLSEENYNMIKPSPGDQTIILGEKQI